MVQYTKNIIAKARELEKVNPDHKALEHFYLWEKRNYSDSYSYEDFDILQSISRALFEIKEEK